MFYVYDHHLYLFFHSDWNTSKTRFLNASTASSGDANRWPRIIFLMCGNKEKSFGAKSGLYGGWPINSKFWPVNKALIWADVRQLALPCWTMIRLSLFVFRIPPSTFGEQNVVYHSEWTVLRCYEWNSRHMISFAEETGHHLLRSETTFVGFGSASKTHTMDCCFVSGLYA